MLSLEIFADVDYASKTTNRWSVSVGAMMCGGACVCLVFLDAKMCHALYEAECVALGHAVIELLFLRQVWRFMIPGNGISYFPVFEDNQGAL